MTSLSEKELSSIKDSLSEEELLVKKYKQKIWKINKRRNEKIIRKYFTSSRKEVKPWQKYIQKKRF